MDEPRHGFSRERGPPWLLPILTRNLGRKPPKKSKKNPDELSSSIKERLANLSNGSTAISIPNGVLGNEDWFKQLVKDEGYTVDLENRTIAKVPE